MVVRLNDQLIEHAPYAPRQECAAMPCNDRSLPWNALAWAASTSFTRYGSRRSRYLNRCTVTSESNHLNERVAQASSAVHASSALHEQRCIQSCLLPACARRPMHRPPSLLYIVYILFLDTTWLLQVQNIASILAWYPCWPMD
jgi:hypothetical protein